MSTVVLVLAACGGDEETSGEAPDVRVAFDSAVDGMEQGDPELLCSSTVLLPVGTTGESRPAADLTDPEIDDAIKSYDQLCAERSSEPSGSGGDLRVELLEVEVSGRTAIGLVHEERYPESDPDPVEFVRSSAGDWRLVMAPRGSDSVQSTTETSDGRATVTTTFPVGSSDVVVGTEVQAGGERVGTVVEVSEDGSTGEAVMSLDPQIYEDGTRAVSITRFGGPRPYLEITLPAPGN